MENAILGIISQRQEIHQLLRGRGYKTEQVECLLRFSVPCFALWRGGTEYRRPCAGSVWTVDMDAPVKSAVAQNSHEYAGEIPGFSEKPGICRATFAVVQKVILCFLQPVRFQQFLIFQNLPPVKKTLLEFRSAFDLKPFRPPPQPSPILHYRNGGGGGPTAGSTAGTSCTWYTCG